MVDELEGWVDEEGEAKPRDEKTDLAKTAVLERIQSENRVFYVQQLQVLHERDFFHWITGRAIRELVDEQRIQAFWGELAPDVNIRLIVRRSYRHWKREGQRVMDLVRRYSVGPLASAIGPYGEIMVDAGLVRWRSSVRQGRERVGWKSMDSH